MSTTSPLSQLEVGLISRPCPVCGGREAKPFADATLDASRLDQFAFASRKQPEYMHYKLGVCRTCQLLYANPAPSAELLAHAYQAAAFDASAESRHAAATYATSLDRVCRTLVDRVGALDIGAGDGAFLEELLARGFSEVQGVEPSAAPIAKANPKVARLIVPAVFRAEDFRPQQFSLITCFQTIEHVPQPLELCVNARKLLKPGGALLLVGHNRRAPLARVLGSKSPIFDIEHLQLFCPASMRALLARAGFRNIKVRPIVNRYPLSYWARLAPVPEPLKAPLLVGLAATGLGKALLSAPVGNMEAVGYK